MNAPMNSAMLEALRLTRAGQLLEATALIQRTLNGGHGTEPAAGATPHTGTPVEHDVFLMDAEPAGHRATRARREDGPATDADFVIVDPEPAARPRQQPRRGPSAAAAAASPARPAWPRFDGAALRGQWQPLHGPFAQPMAKGAPAPLPEGAQFLTASFTNHAGTRAYRLYVPSAYHGQPLPLVVMLHGCTQDPDDFAAGTKMNELAEKRHCLVLYPAQTGGANVSKCWNWFKGGDQQRDQGEPSIIAGMTCQVCDSHAVDQRRIYVAGLSAGGAMAMTMAVTYPELYAAVGIHSGLPHAVARDLPSALAAMQQGRAAPLGGDARTIAGAQAVAAIVFHGDRDTTVHPGNGDQVISQCMPPTAPQRTQGAPEPRVTVQRGQVPQGHAYTRTLYQRIDGQAIAEHWLIHGAGHAWSGGSASGSYTDPKGPDATGEMMRFFLENPRPEVAG
ncbi:extracellular catalytic domain type 1 short-chain-length polyhydroxyalkanoate depolymerase [Thauera phenolivorans]|uniref:extracellular catalytic domain type 1 short-chain-length polyhydroxyalkanoate depolymerase n=1 Tax=Thauera phenolivorans TaxID=1792543 RepID=UPI00083A2377|nr:PHB depolymerase family esterase [Thauera phenolivorans]